MEVEEKQSVEQSGHQGIKSYYKSRIDALDINLSEKEQNLRRLEAQRNELNSKGQFIKLYLLNLIM